MIKDSKYTKTFVTQELTKEKHMEIRRQAELIRDFKNALSEEVCRNVNMYLDLNKTSFITHIRRNFDVTVNSCFDNHAITDVYVAYENKFDTIRYKLTFENVTFCGFEYYKRKSKNKQAGDLKRVIVKRSKTLLSSALTYLARYGNDGTVDYINKQIDNQPISKSQLEYYQNILRCIDKFGFDRLMSLATLKQERVLNRYNKPIVFDSLTFSGRSRKSKLIDHNKNYNSVINSFITLSGFERKTLDIPVKHAKSYHGNMRDYFKSSNEYNYLVTFDKVTGKIKISICQDGERYIPEIDSNSKAVGIDVNIKHNLFSCSDGTTYDYNHKLVKDYCNFSLELDNMKANGQYINRKKQAKLASMANKMTKFNQQLIANMCRKFQSDGVKHIVMEDLNNGFGRSFVKDKDNNDINFNRIVKFLGISSLKDEFTHIARNYDIAVSTVHSSYTSKMCPECGCIEDGNRPNQETFRCVECGHSDNADHNASVNIRNRATQTVFATKLLKPTDNGSYIPKVMSRDKLKEILLSHRCIPTNK